MRERVGKSRNTVFFQWFGAPEGRKVGSLKRRVRSHCWPEERWKVARRCGAKRIWKSKCTKHTILGPLLEVEMSKKCTPLWREAHFQVKMYKAHHSRTTFGSWDVEKVHAVVARSTFPSQNVQNTSAPDHFWKLRCRKSARRCGAKHISKSKCTKHLSSGPLLEVEMSKKCTPLWREAHFQVKMYRTPHVRATFGSSDVEKVHAIVARSKFPSQNVQNTTCSRHFWRFRCRKSARRCGAKHISHFEVKMLKTPGVRTTFGGSDVASLHYTTLHHITLHYTPLHYAPLHYTTLHNTTTTTTQLHSTTLHYTKLHYTTLHYTTLHYTTTTTTSTQLHSTTIHSTTLHYTPLH